MEPLIEFITRLIYASGAEAILTPNHRDWLAANPSPTGSQWLAHHVDAMLAAFDGWLASLNLPPVIPWDGTVVSPWTPGVDVPLDPALDGSFTGIGSLEQLGAALRDRYTTVAAQAQEIAGLEKAPFSERYWAYVKWASRMRERYNGGILLPPDVIYDRDGTILSAMPFLDSYNDLHRNWHVNPTPASGPTPGLLTSAGQRAGLGGVGMPGGEEFIKFHRDHVQIFNNWMERTGQAAVRPVNMGFSWPQPAQAGNNPSTWTEPDQDPWINAEGGDSDNHLQAKTSVDQIGNDISGYHGAGHGANSDIGPLAYNNYVPRFFAWHGWIDSQWWWREPHFARWNTTTGLRERVFRPVLNTDVEWPGLYAMTILRDPLASADVISPANALASADLTTGAGTLRMKFYVKDPYNRNLTLKLKAEVFDDATSTTVPVETIPEAANTYTIGAGGDFPLETEFTVDFTFSSAFQSDDPTRANPAVGFTNSRIRISGTLEVPGGTDPGFVHRDFVDIDLVQEKQAPDVQVYLDLSSFSKDQVDSAMSGGEARFANALIIAVQDRTSAPAPIAWPAEVADEVKGLLTRPVPASGLFDDTAHAPAVEIWQETVDTPFTGLSVELASGPLKEDASLADNLPQRYTYRYDVVFTSGHTAFDGLPLGGMRLARLRVPAYDRAGNQALAIEPIKLFTDANPYMRDGDPSWLSIDTRVFRLFENDAKFGAMLSAADPNGFIQQVIQNLNTAATGGDTFEGLPTDQPGSALEYSTEIENPSTSTSQKVFNFALAKVRLQGSGGAANVRAFFRLFRYTASNLIFDPVKGYRFFDDGAGRKIPLLGFTSAAPGASLTSIPFFAAARQPYGASMTAQTDTPNVATFPPGPSGERVIYFGAYLDINQNNARLPSSYIAVHPDGGYTAGEVQPIRSLMLDAHQCMVVEVKYDGDPTQTGDTPASSDNLAQRNLMILYTDNPGAPLTHTVQHSFEADLSTRRPQAGPGPDLAAVGHRGMPAEMPGMETEEGQPMAGDGDGRMDLHELWKGPLHFISAEQRQSLVMEEAMSLAMQNPKARNFEEMMNAGPFMDEAMMRVNARFPFVFDPSNWQQTGEVFDELLFLWNGLPEQARVELYLPRVNCEQVINLRNLRHAPGDVKIVDSHTLLLTPRDSTYVPLPPVAGGRLAGVVTIALPEGIKKGQKWQVDVVQVRGGERRTTGGFQINIQVSEAKLIADAERRLLEVMYERLALTPLADPWHPVLARRVATIRQRAQALADSAGIPWQDPTQWSDPDQPGQTHPLEGRKIQVVLEKIEILDDHDPWIKGRGEIRFLARVRTADNGGIEQATHLPEHGVYRIGDRPGHNVQEIDQVIFSGYAANDLGIEIAGLEEDSFDPDDNLGRYVRLFRCPVQEWLGEYRPGDEPIDPEEVGSWRVWYRIEAG